MNSHIPLFTRRRMLATLAVTVGAGQSIVSDTVSAGHGPQGDIPLLAGQDEPVGRLHIEVSNDRVSVTYDTSCCGWHIDETHLHLGRTLEDFPRTPTGNPSVGLFDYADAPVKKNGTVATYSDLPLPPGEGDFLVAAHAIVSSPGRSETAWADGEPFVESSLGNWATYVVVSTVDCISLAVDLGTQYEQLRELELWDPFLLSIGANDPDGMPIDGSRTVEITVTNHHGSFGETPRSIAQRELSDLPFSDGLAVVTIGSHAVEEDVDLRMPCTVGDLCDVDHIETIEVTFPTEATVHALEVCPVSLDG